MQYKFLLLAFLPSIYALLRPFDYRNVLSQPIQTRKAFLKPFQPYTSLPQHVKRDTALQLFSVIPEHMILNIFGTDLEGIVTARALISSLITNLRAEFTGDRLFLKLYYPNLDTFVYISISLVFVYGQWKFYKGSQNIERFQKIESFNKKENVIKNIIFIILFVFTKDVLSAA